MNETISIIVPVYNIEEYIEQCVESISNQTYQNLEIILVDDGSKDNSGAICDMLAKKDNRIHVIHKENGGVSSARNAGLDYAHGDYIAFVDGDDYIENEMYEKLFGKMRNGVDIVFCYSQKNYPDGTIRICEEKVLKEVIKKPGDIRPFLVWAVELKDERGKYVDRAGVACYLSLYKKGIIDDASLRFPEGIKMGEDRLFLMSYLNECKQAALIEEPLYHYRKGRDFAATSLANAIYLDFEHEKKKYLLKKQIVESNKYYSQDLKFFLYLHLEQEFYFTYTTTQIRYNQNYKKTLNLYVQDEEIKRIQKFLTIKRLKKTGYRWRHIIILKLIKYRMYKIVHFLQRLKKHKI